MQLPTLMTTVVQAASFASDMSEHRSDDSAGPAVLGYGVACIWTQLGYKLGLQGSQCLNCSICNRLCTRIVEHWMSTASDAAVALPVA